MNPPTTFSQLRCQKIKFLEKFIQFDDKNTRPEIWRGDKYTATWECRRPKFWDAWPLNVC